MARTVLLADDSVTAQNMGRRILMDAGYEVITVNNGSAALKKIHDARPDLIVLDVYMPGYGGLEVCQRLKESRETMKIPVLLTVGKMEPFKPEEARRVRADAHIVKPFDASELLAALTKLEDRIVPQADSRGRRNKPDMPAVTWQIEVDPLTTQPDWSDKVDYLAQAKQRQTESVPEQFEEEIAETGPSAKPLPELSPLPENAPELEVVPEATLQGASPNADLPSLGSEAIAPPAPEAQPQTQQEKPNPAADAVSSSASQSHWVAESVPLSAEEAAIELEQEMQRAQAAIAITPPSAPAGQENSVSASPEPVTSRQQAETETAKTSAEDSGATFAAAASAGSVSSTPANSVQDSVTVAHSSPADPQNQPEAAAAWENWQHIRDAVMQAQAADGVADALSKAAQANTSAPAKNGDRDSSPIESDAVASIVDTVLAELKPRLMEEIAKKLKK